MFTSGMKKVRFRTNVLLILIFFLVLIENPLGKRGQVEFSSLKIDSVNVCFRLNLQSSCQQFAGCPVCRLDLLLVHSKAVFYTSSCFTWLFGVESNSCSVESVAIVYLLWHFFHNVINVCDMVHKFFFIFMRAVFVM